MVFVKITVLFKKNPDSVALVPEDLDMREMHIRADTVRNVYPSHQIDNAIVTQCYVVTDTATYSCIESSEEILDRLEEALEKWKKLP